MCGLPKRQSVSSSQAFIACFSAGKLVESSTCANFAHTEDDGKTYQYKFYNLPAIIAVGYRAKSPRATEFHQWATQVLETFTKQGYVLVVG